MDKVIVNIKTFFLDKLTYNTNIVLVSDKHHNYIHICLKKKTDNSVFQYLDGLQIWDLTVI